MDPYKLLSRSTKLKGLSSGQKRNTPSSGQHARPQLFPPEASSKSEQKTTSRKRKRGQDVPAISPDELGGLDFFGKRSEIRANDAGTDEVESSGSGAVADDTPAASEKLVDSPKAAVELSVEERKSLLRQHKLKITWLNPTLTKEKHKGTSKKELYLSPLRSFSELKQRYGISNRLAANIEDQGYSTPTEVQLGALPLLLDAPATYLGSDVAVNGRPQGAHDVNLITVAPTGSGKTLAFMIPLLYNIQRARQISPDMPRRTTGIILAPTKELASQIVNEGRKLADGTGVKVTQLRKGMQLAMSDDYGDDKGAYASHNTAVKADILVSTPGMLHSLLEKFQHNPNTTLPDVRHLILDEADVLLDPLFRDQSLGIWNRLSNRDLRVSLWSATMGSNIEELARSTIDTRQEQLVSNGGGPITEMPLVRLIVGLKDSAIPNVEHRLVYAATEQGKLMGLRQLLHPTATIKESGPPLLPPFLVFTQTIERAVALHSELMYDIPAEAGGISRIAVLHSDLSDTARDKIMTRFRKGEIWVLITTDLLSRGVDFRGVNGVVNYDIPTSTAAYVHRVGRTGRAGRDGGTAVTLYSKEDTPYLKHVVNVIAIAQNQGGGKKDGGLEKWLLDTLPSLSKREKQKLKKHGIESRTARGRETDPKAARRTRISSKAGFVRQAENNRRGAIVGSKRRFQKDAAATVGDESDFGGFD